MYNVILKNRYGSLDLMKQKDYICIDIDNISGADATINENNNPNIDGSYINGGKIQSRTINLTIKLLSNFGESRKEIYRYAVVNEDLTLILVNDIRNVSIEGRVKKIETPLFTSDEKMTISILCPNPFFRETINTINEFSTTLAKFHFPFALDSIGEPFSYLQTEANAFINNGGDVVSGLILKYEILGAVINPKIYNLSTGEYLLLSDTFQNGDKIIINTNQKEKSIYLYRGTTKTNLLGKMAYGSSWLTLAQGTNIITYTCTSGVNNIYITATFTNKFIGV